MKPFLKEIAEALYKEPEEHLENIWVVFPNKRAGLFLQHYLGECYNKPFFSPKITGINDFISENTSLQIEDPVYLLLDLYTVHQEIEQKEALSFSEFFGLGEMMIRDFSDIDSSMADFSAIFSWLNSEKALLLWNLDQAPLTEFQKKYLTFYQSLSSYYTLFKERLLKKNKAFEGMAFRHLATHIDSISDSFPYTKIWFCGFNALSKSEQLIFQHLEKAKKAVILWDTDAYYMNNEIQEAGTFLRKYRKSFSSFATEVPSFFKENKTIHIIGTPENVLQAKVAGQLLEKELSHHSDLNSTAVVLADESLLPPMLNSLPQSINHVNITMGYDFLQTPLHDLIFHLFTFQMHSPQNEKGTFYYEYAEKIIQNDLIKKILNIQPDSSFKKKMEELGRTYISVSDLEWICRSLFIEYSHVDFLFNPSTSSADFLLMLEKLLALFVSEETDHPLLQEYTLALHSLLKCFLEIPSELLRLSTLKIFFQIYIRFAKKIKIPFYGEPLKGIQLMGMLETRCLDFDRIILLSANEGILPSGKQANSLIPFQLKKQFGIPTYQDRDAIFAYHFYRLLQRAKEVYLIYYTENNGLNKGEKSRFLKQIQVELPAYNPEILIQESQFISSTVASVEKITTEVKKDFPTLALLAKKLTFPGLSPTAIITYTHCSLRFYYLYILRIKEEKIITDEITPDIFGSVCHDVLEQAFLPGSAQNGFFQPSTLEQFLPQLEGVFTQFLKKHFKNETQYGKNKLATSVALHQLETFLTNQITFLKNHNTQIIDLEKKLEHTEWYTVNNQKRVVKFIGYTDRIDCVEGQVRIIDYKTGKVNPSDVRMNNSAEAYVHIADKDKWVQLMMYAWLLSKSQSIPPPYISGIYSLRDYKGRLFTALTDGEELITEEHIQNFNSIIEDLVVSIFDKKTPFMQTEKKEHCSYCQFAAICGR